MAKRKTDRLFLQLDGAVSLVTETAAGETVVEPLDGALILRVLLQIITQAVEKEASGV
jgi:hypothetical protein